MISSRGGSGLYVENFRCPAHLGITVASVFAINVPGFSSVQGSFNKYGTRPVELTGRKSFPALMASSKVLAV